MSLLCLGLAAAIILTSPVLARWAHTAQRVLDGNLDTNPPQTADPMLTAVIAVLGLVLAASALLAG